MTKEIDKTTGEIVVTEKKEIEKADIDSYLSIRQDFIKKVNAICIEGKDYHVIQGKKSLAKGGAEKIASIFKWNASFKADEDTLKMVGDTPGLIAYVCTLTQGDNFIGEGRGSALVAKNQGDVNKTIKMAQKSAFIDAVLRSSGLSDFFTQDLEDMNRKNISDFKKEVEADEFLADAGEPPYVETKDDVCEDCGDRVTAGVKSFSVKEFNKTLCYLCQKKERLQSDVISNE